ncbi:uncharacterized protein [Choristoneura fumiferana]|uniref:uncharacterized protein n=1 Tax=Choristoneura fumiferana TaxID=7141 RepID=UPI003D1564BD
MVECSADHCLAVSFGINPITSSGKAECSGTECNSVCMGLKCEAKCSGTKCNTKCVGVSCKAECEGLNCHAVCEGLSCQNTTPELTENNNELRERNEYEEKVLLSSIFNKLKLTGLEHLINRRSVAVIVL